MCFVTCFRQNSIWSSTRSAPRFSRTRPSGTSTRTAPGCASAGSPAASRAGTPSCSSSAEAPALAAARVVRARCDPGGIAEWKGLGSCPTASEDRDRLRIAGSGRGCFGTALWPYSALIADTAVSKNLDRGRNRAQASPAAASRAGSPVDSRAASISEETEARDRGRPAWSALFGGSLAEPRQPPQPTAFWHHRRR